MRGLARHEVAQRAAVSMRMAVEGISAGQSSSLASKCGSASGLRCRIGTPAFGQ
jgi:hypothetical protein